MTELPGVRGQIERRFQGQIEQALNLRGLHPSTNACLLLARSRQREAQTLVDFGVAAWRQLCGDFANAPGRRWKCQ
jgi:hypothetical protein